MMIRCIFPCRFKNRKIRFFHKRMLSGFLAVLLLISAASVCSGTVLAAESSSLKTVRVAVEDSEIFFQTEKNGNPTSGYAYEYIQSIGAYAGWKVEYLPVKSFSDCLQAVTDGTADLFYDVSYTEERTGWLLYPDTPMGAEEYYLFCRSDNQDIRSDDLSSFNGKRVGVTDDTIEHEQMQLWCEANGITLEIVDFPSDSVKDDALNSGDIDLECEVSMLASNNFSALVKVAESDYYLVAGKAHADLIEDINSACVKISEVNKYFVEHLNEKYFAKSVISQTLSRDEAQWISSHDTLRVGYMDNFLPFSDRTQEGNADGIVKDVVPFLLKTLGVNNSIDVTYVGYESNTDMYAALSEGELDAVFPVYDDIHFGVHNGMLITEDVLNLSADLVFCGNYSNETTAAIAVNRNDLIQDYYTRSNYPDAEILYCDSIEDALQAVADGRAGSVILNGLRTSGLLSDSDFENMTTLRLPPSLSLSFGVSQENYPLLSLFNRAVFNADEGFAFNYVFNYINSDSASLTKLIRRNAPFLLSFLLLITAIMTLLSVALYRSRRKLISTKFVDDKLVEKYDAIYLLDLNTNEIRAVESSRISKVGHFTGTKNYTETALRFAETVAPKYKADWIIFSDPAYLKRYMTRADSREFIYELPGTEKPLRRFTLDVVERINGEPSVLLLSFAGIDDISARNMLLQNQLAEQAKKLENALVMAESASKAKTSFLFNMSHDIRTPMNAIVGFTDMAKKNLDNKAKVSECLDKTGQASELLLSLINNVLEMSRIEAGKTELNETPGKVDCCFDRVRDTMTELAKTKSIDLSFEFGPITDHYVYADASLTLRIFVNMISNAIKYSNRGGWVRVRCEQVGRQDETHGLYRYTFADNGIGMGEEFQKHLFDAFSRENNSTVSGVQGSGLGLSVVKAFVELMHGTVECKSKPDEGSVFTVTLPYRLQKDDEVAQYTESLTEKVMTVRPEEAKPVKFNFSGKRILVVEDNEMNREIASFILDEAQITVEEAEDGTVAVELLRQKGPDYYDAVLMDIQMPRMNGYEATKAIREMYPDAVLPIIALSANAFEEDKAVSVENGMNDHIAKPINTEELFTVLSNCLKK